MEKPKLLIKTPLIGKILNMITLITFLSSFLYLISQWSYLPNQVPTHYNFIGEPDNWEQKGLIFLPLIIGILLWLGLHFLEKYPHLHNHNGLTTENTEQKYKNSMMLLNFIKNELLLFFAFGSFNDVLVAKGKDSLLGIWELPLFLFIIFGTLAFFIIQSFRIK